MADQDPSRGFEQRLIDFGPELGPFLGTAWNNRGTVDLNSALWGVNTLYILYSGPDAAPVPYNKANMTSFANRVKGLAAGKSTWIQSVSYLKGFEDMNAATILVLGRALWRTFFHVSSGGSTAVNKRVYVHCATMDAGLSLMTKAVGWMSSIQGFRSIKIAGPGSINRNDTIVAYVSDGPSQTALVQKFQDTAKTESGLFADGLPSLVKQVGRGIGTADEPPEMRILPKGKSNFSYGSFYATLIWLALKTTPGLGGTPKLPAGPTGASSSTTSGGEPDGRHFLDNMLYILRTLQIDPKNQDSFPARAQLEAFQREYEPKYNL
jgi:hypothetical protein